MEDRSSVDEVKAILQKCTYLHASGDYEQSLELANSPKAQKAPVELLPYVLEMQVRNMMDLL